MKRFAAACLFPLLFLSSQAYSKALVGAGDLAYVGSFKLPTSYGGFNFSWARGLAVRWVNGERRFYTWGIADELGEFSYPGLSRAAPYPTATGLHAWDGAPGITTPQVDGTNGSKKTIGLHWDTTDSRLYFTYGETYCAGGCSVSDPSLGFITFNDAAGTVQGSHGVWNVGGNLKTTMGGVLEIPSAFATAYTGGKRLAIGFGGNWSSHSQGPVSSGPALKAFRPPTTEPSGTVVPSVPLLEYPWSVAKDAFHGRLQRDADYTVEDETAWAPAGGVGYWTTQDYISQGGVWIDTPTKEGVLFVYCQGNGRIWYESSEPHAERGKHVIAVYDPVDLAAVARGAKKSYEIQPKNYWPIQFPGIRYPLPRYDGLPYWNVVGVSFDPTENRLYVHVQFGTDAAVGVGEHASVIHVYKVTDGAAGALSSPSGMRFPSGS